MSPFVITVIAWFTAAMSPFGAGPGLPSQPLRTEAELRAVLETKPSELAPYLELARLYSQTGRIEEGVQVLRRALAVHPQTGAVFEAMVMLYGGPGNLDHREKIAGVAEEWVKADPSNPKPLVLLGQVHFERALESRQQPGEALIHLDRARQAADDARRLSPTDRMPHALWLAIAKQRLDLTEDPAERARLQHEIEVDAKEFARMVRMGGSGAPPDAVGGPPPSTTSPSPSPQPLRVGGDIKVPTKIKDVKPVYPPEALQARVQGVVILEITIDEAGRVAEARVLRSIPLLDQAAEEAVRQWEFAPTLINGSPVPIVMTATVQFSLPQSQ